MLWINSGKLRYIFYDFSLHSSRILLLLKLNWRDYNAYSQNKTSDNTRGKDFIMRNIIRCILFSIILYSSYIEAKTDFCYSLPGPWHGNTELKYVIRNKEFHCQYETFFKFSTPASDRYHFTAEMVMQRNSTACFLSPKLTLTGSCDKNTGEIRILTKDANLNGWTDANHMNLQGTMNIGMIVAEVLKLEIEKN